MNTYAWTCPRCGHQIQPHQGGNYIEDAHRHMHDHVNEDEPFLDTFEHGTTINELVTVLTRFRPDARIGLFPRTGGGCTLAILDDAGDGVTRIWADL